MVKCIGMLSKIDPHLIIPGIMNNQILQIPMHNGVTILTTKSIYTQQLIDSINSYWMTEYRVDGFRFDFTKGFGNNIKGNNDPWGK